MSRAMFSIYNLFCLFVTFVTTANAAFSFTTSGTIYSIDTGATPSLTFTINSTSGNILTQVFDGVNYQSTTQKTQVNGGLTAFGGLTACTIEYEGTSNREPLSFLTDISCIAHLLHRIYQNRLHHCWWYYHSVLCFCLWHCCFVWCNLQINRTSGWWITIYSTLQHIQSSGWFLGGRQFQQSCREASIRRSYRGLRCIPCFWWLRSQYHP